MITTASSIVTPNRGRKICLMLMSAILISTILVYQTQFWNQQLLQLDQHQNNLMSNTDPPSWINLNQKLFCQRDRELLQQVLQNYRQMGFKNQLILQI